MDKFLPKSALQEKIEKATDEGSPGDPGAFVSITDSINSLNDGPKECLKAVLKRLKHKNPKVALSTLKLLDASVKNCGERFHQRLVSKEFLPDYVKILKAPDVNKDVKMKMLDLIQSWAAGLEYNGMNEPIIEVQTQLLCDGLEFPPREYSSFEQYSPKPRYNGRNLASINASMGAPVQFRDVFGFGKGTQGAVLNGPAAPVSYTPQQSEQIQQMTIAQIKASLVGIRSTLDLFSEMLSFFDPSSEKIEENELLVDCFRTARVAQQRLGSFLQYCQDDDLNVQMLLMIDEFNTLLATFSSYTSSSSSPPSQPQPKSRPSVTAAPSFQSPPQPASKPSGDAPLISFDDEEPEQPLRRPAPPNTSSSSSSSSAAALLSLSSPPFPAATTPSTPFAPFSPYSPLSAISTSPIEAEDEDKKKMKEILGVDPDEFSEDQLAFDLASLGFTKEQLLELKKNQGNLEDQESENESEGSIEGDSDRLFDPRKKS